jgi:threonine/homoserine/homoserine lactone efflux protein
VVGSGISESLTLFFLSAMPPSTVKNKYGTVLSFCFFGGFCLICSLCFVIVPCLFHHLKNLRQKVMCKIYIAECSITTFILPVFNTACESCPG